MTGTPSRSAPGYPELIVGLVVLAIVGIGGSLALVRMHVEPVALGISLSAMSGVGGLAGFFAAYFLRLRSWSAFDIVRTSWRWIAIGAAAGVVAFVAKSAAIVTYVALTSDHRTIQDVYATGASGGPLAATATTFFLSVVTPIGEEFLFRGVVTTVLLRHGAWVGVLGGATVFAVFHGLNMIFPAALVTGLVAGEMFRRSGSIWPAVTVHVVVNLPTIPAMLLSGVGR